MANTAWAMATLGHVDVQFLHQLLDCAQTQLHDFKPQELANTAWAVATLDHADKQFLGQLLECAGPKLQDFTPQALVNTAWAMAKLGHADKRAMDQLLVHARSSVSDFSPQDVASTVWAMATLGHVDKPFLIQLLSHAKPKLCNFNPQALSNTAWAMATLGHVDDRFLQQLLLHAGPKLRDFGPQELSNTAWAMATLAYADAKFLSQLLEQARAKLRDLTHQQLANTALAMATLHYDDPELLDALLQRLLAGPSIPTPQHLCNTMWALSILHHNEPAIVGPILSAAYTMLASPGFPSDGRITPKGLCQAHQYLVTMEASGHISSGAAAAPAYQQLRAACQSAWDDSLQSSRTSFTQKEVLASACLLPGCARAQSEQPTEDLLLNMDIALQLPCGTKVAVEVDGPFHFMSNAPHVPDGSTVWRNRMLEARGWRVVSVPVVEWWKQGKDPKRRQEYLIHRLKQEGVALPGWGEDGVHRQSKGSGRAMKARGGGREGSKRVVPLVRAGAAAAPAPGPVIPTERTARGLPMGSSAVATMTAEAAVLGDRGLMEAAAAAEGGSKAHSGPSALIRGGGRRRPSGSRSETQA